MNNNDCTIRLEKESDHRKVEQLVRDSFWNVYRPGCVEHFVLKKLRDDPAFVPALDFVMEQDGRLIGQNIFVKAELTCDDGRVLPILTMGPICIANDRKRRGFGKQLLTFCLQKAAEQGYGAVLFEGNIDFYGTCGFQPASNFGVRYNGLPATEDTSFFLCKELIAGYLNGVTGNYTTPPGYFAAQSFPAEFAEYEAAFPYKEKLHLPGQLE